MALYIKEVKLTSRSQFARAWVQSFRVLCGKRSEGLKVPI